MTLRAHSVGGIAVALVYVKLFPQPYYFPQFPACNLAFISSILLAVCGSLFPDLDIHFPGADSKGHWYSHRGILHSILLACLFTLFIFHPYRAFGFGWLMHLIQDCFTYSGVPLFVGYRPRVSLKLFSTGSIAEIPITLIIFGISACIFCLS
jgi:membrane-bound metal-dependent hydrolase YbcI (DUF457 family)